MNPILHLITETFHKKETKNLNQFIHNSKTQNEFYLVTDYCFGEDDKQNNVFSFSLLQTDIKKANESFESYVDNPLAYHFSFIIPYENKLLEHFK